MKKKQLILIDGSSYLYRAFHALPNLSASDGQPTGAVYGVVNMVRKLVQDHQPDYVAVVFDARGKTFRDQLYPDYKANRPPMPDELGSQIPLLHQLIKALGVPLLSVPGVEADDVIATLAEHARNSGLETLVSTGDKDMAQIVDHDVRLIDTMKDVVFDRAKIEEKFGVAPDRIVDYLALVGDVSDNIPGVPKVGPKTAAKWLAQYHSLDELVAHADKLGGKVGENFRNSLAQLPLSRELVTVKRDVDLEVTPADLKPAEPDTEKLKELYSRLEFRAWLKELGGLEDATTGADHYEIILDETALQRWLTRLETSALVAFDTETTSLDAVSAKLVGMSFATEVGTAVYLPIGHDYPDAPGQLPRATVVKTLKPILEDPNRPKVGQNLKYDHCVLQSEGIELRGIRFDTMLESYVLDSVATRHDMDGLAMKHLGYKTISFEEVAGKGKAQVTFDKVPVEQAGRYAAEDADVTLRLHETLWPKLAAEPRLKSLFETIEMPLVTVLSRMERSGVKIDRKMLAAQSEALASRIAALESEAHATAGEEFNIASPKQIQRILYEELKLPVLRKTPKGQPSTAENVLQELAADYELPRLILEYRGLSKLKSTYTDKLPEMINPVTGRLHTSYHQAVAATGRLSSADPNLQNIPIRTSEGKRIREAFIPENGFVLLAADYSQIELRIMAHLSGDEGLNSAFAEGTDVHRATAAEVFGVSPAAVSDEQRRHAKAINFGLIYGMSAFGLAQQLRIQRGAAQEYVDLYFSRYPGVKRFMDETRALAHERGYVETLFGRRLYLPEINSSNHARRQYAERTAINAPMQGTAADLIKMAMVVIDEWIRGRDDVRMIMQVHDELVFEVNADAAETVKDAVVKHMTSVAQLSVPLEVDVGTGANWAEAHS